MPELSIPEVSLNDGSSMPALGFGTYDLNGDDAIRGVTDAIEVGYHLIDSAVNYGNESEVGRAIGSKPHDSVVVTTKVPGRDHGYDETLRSFQGSLERLGRIDLYLIHWPMPRLGKYVDSWRAMVDLQRDGLVRSIGVSNFTARHLDAVIEATGVLPAVNQVELHPEFPQTELREVHRQLGICTESWTPLGDNHVFARPEITEPAQKYGKSSAQIVLRWHIELGAVPIPKSADPSRRRANAQVFDFSLTEAEVAAISALGRPDGRLWGGDPDTNEEL
jgi:diketogulonate reductase-like aldo/keto reductase